MCFSGKKKKEQQIKLFALKLRVLLLYCIIIIANPMALN